MFVYVIILVLAPVDSDGRHFTKSVFPVEIDNDHSQDVDLDELRRLLQLYASKDKWILITLIDSASLDIALDFYESSLHRLNIENYLFVSCDWKAYHEMIRRNIHCFMYYEDGDSDFAAMYSSEIFRRKMNLRTYMILDMLSFGYNILHTDADMYFFKNPFVAFNYERIEFDVAPMWDYKQHNAGFIFIRNSTRAKNLYTALEILTSETTLEDQTALNNIAMQMIKSDSLLLHSLPKSMFLNGYYYFTHNRYFPETSTCKECVVVHNNFVVGLDAKRYRFREAGFWNLDDGYYTDYGRKYLTYKNNKGMSGKEQIQSLQAAFAIGEILNRTVIMPRFYAGHHETSVLNYLLLRDLLVEFPNYRENCFLRHRKVPKEISNSVSDTFLILNKKIEDLVEETPKQVKLLKPTGKHGALDTEIKQWFLKENAKVLVFHSLHGAFEKFHNSHEQKRFEERVRNSFKRTIYTQSGPIDYEY